MDTETELVEALEEYAYKLDPKIFNALYPAMKLPHIIGISMTTDFYDQWIKSFYLKHLPDTLPAIDTLLSLVGKHPITIDDTLDNKRGFDFVTIVKAEIADDAKLSNLTIKLGK